MDHYFADICQSYGYQILSLTHSFEICTTFKGVEVSTSQVVSIQLFRDITEALHRNLCEACEIQRKLANLPNIIQLKNSFEMTSGEKLSFAIVSEWMQKDLYLEISNRVMNHFQWTWEALMLMASEMIETLAVLQENQIAHRGLKPQNVFIDGRQKVKIGNFVYARNITPDFKLDFLISTSSPLYLSPELSIFLQGQVYPVDYSPYKSDVYSLGMILLNSFRLDLTSEFAPEMPLEQAILQALSYINNLNFQHLLYRMLQINPENRPDFLQLWAWLNSDPPQPANPNADLAIDPIIEQPVPGEEEQSQMLATIEKPSTEIADSGEWKDSDLVVVLNESQYKDLANVSEAGEHQGDDKRKKRDPCWKKCLCCFRKNSSEPKEKVSQENAVKSAFQYSE